MSGIFSALPNIVWQVGTQVSVSNGSASQLQASSPTILAKHGVMVQAPSSNSASIWVGTSSVTNTQGIELSPGQTVTITQADPSKIYVYATSTGQKANYAWV